MTELEIRPITPEELPEFLRHDALAFGTAFDESVVESERATLELDRTLAVFDAGRIVAAAAAVPFALTLPGLTFLPVAGVTYVGVRPTHRRRGLLRLLMERQLDDMAARGDALAILSASESGIYGRFGYGLATSTASIEIDPHYATFRQPIDVTGRLALIDRTQALAVLPDVYDRARRLQPGAIDRSAALWHSILRDSPQRDQSDGPRFYVTYESARVRTLSQLDGAAVYRIKERWADDLPANVLTVREVLATTPQAYAALWQYLLSVDLVGAVRAEERPVDEPLRWLLVEPRRLRTTRLGDELWVRLLDIPMALTARRYATRDALVFEVHDALRPQIGGRYALDGSPEGATCRPTTSSPDLVLGVAELGATYLGGVTFSTLTRAGRVEEVTAGALRRADTLFAAERAPFCGTSF